MSNSQCRNTILARIQVKVTLEVPWWWRRAAPTSWLVWCPGGMDVPRTMLLESMLGSHNSWDGSMEKFKATDVRPVAYHSSQSNRNFFLNIFLPIQLLK